MVSIWATGGHLWPLFAHGSWAKIRAMFDPTFSHPETLRNEPVRRWGALATSRILLVHALTTLLWAILSLPFWPAYLLLRIFFPRPPTVPSVSRQWHCAVAIWTDWSPDGPTLAMRISLFLVFLRHAMTDGFAGFAWLLDELLWGRELANQPIIEPVFEISAARSGSTQLARYIEDDPQICAPNGIEIAAPFLWFWRLLPSLERIFPKDWRDRLANEKLPPELHERHEPRRPPRRPCARGRSR